MATTTTAPSPSSTILPTLASALLDYEQEGFRHLREGSVPVTGQKGGGKRGGGSGRGRSIRTGVEKIDREMGESLFSCGTVIGFGGVAEMHPQSLLLIHNLISTYIIDTNTPLNPSSPPNHPPSHTPSPPTVFILEPPTTPSTSSSLLEVYTLLEKHVSAQQQHIRSPSPRTVNLDADTLINEINVLPYFDLIGISQALTEISESIAQSVAPTTDPAPLNSSSHTTTNPKIILFRSLGPTLAQQLSQSANSSVYSGGLGGSKTSVNASAHTRIFALLGQVLGQLRRLARSSGGNQVLVLVEAGVQRVRVGSTGSGTEFGGRSGNGVDTLALRSSFSSADGKGLRLGLDVGESESDGGGGGRAHVNFRKSVVKGNELAARMVEDTLDSVVVLHDGFGVVERGSQARGTGSRERKCILEVTKDPAGGNTGRWTVWNG